MKANLLANYGGTVFVAVSQIVVIPLYLGWLGDRDWGVLSTIVAVSSALLILEAGVSMATARGFAQGHAGGGFAPLQRRYFWVAGAVAVVSGVLSPIGGALFFQAAGSRAAVLFALTGSMAAAQIAGALYRAVLVGAGRQVHLNLSLIGFTALRHAVACLLAYATADVTLVAACFALGFAAEAVVRRAMVRVLLPELSRRPQSATGSMRPAAGALPLSIAGACGALATQVDRLVLSVLTPPAELGRYAIAATLSLAGLQLVYPLSTALLPRLPLFADPASAQAITRRSYAFVSALLVVMWVVTALLTNGGLVWWLPSPAVSDVVARLLVVHLIGTSLNILCVPIYLRLLARRADQSILVANGLALGLQVAVLLGLTQHYGVLSGGLSWICANAVLLLAYCLAVRSKNHAAQ